MKPVHVVDNIYAVIVPKNIKRFWIYLEANFGTRLGQDANWSTWHMELEGNPSDWQIVGEWTEYGNFIDINLFPNENEKVLIIKKVK